MSALLETLNWRYATKKFDSDKKISQKDLDILLEATRLSISSYGLQPYHVFVITDPELRERLKPASWGQSQITDASHLIVFANKTDFDHSLIDDYISNVGTTRNMPLESVAGLGDFMKSKLLPLPAKIKAQWTAKQAYIALGNLINAAADLRIDACAMEGFDAEVYNDILGLSDKNLNTAVIATIGYRSEEDQTQHYAKVRQSKENLFTYL